MRAGLGPGRAVRCGCVLLAGPVGLYAAGRELTPGGLVAVLDRAARAGALAGGVIPVVRR